MEKRWTDKIIDMVFRGVLGLVIIYIIQMLCVNQNFPVLAGVSRKRFLQDVINTKEPRDADIQSVLAASWLIQNEIEYVRVHDVDLTMQALKFNDRLYTFS